MRNVNCIVVALLYCAGCLVPTIQGLVIKCSSLPSPKLLRRNTLLGMRQCPSSAVTSASFRIVPLRRTCLSMHMGHSHSHHDHVHSSSSSNSNSNQNSFENFMSTVQEFQPRQFIFRRRRLVAMIVFLAVAILGPPLVLPVTVTKRPPLGRSEFTIFGVAVAAVTAAEPLRNAVLQMIQRLRSLQQGIANHSAPITASYLFANKNAADRVTLLGGFMNIVLSIAKLAVGVTCHSTALIADAGHSLSDLFSDVVTLWAVHVARLPPDQDHPQGHGKFEAIGALFLSLTLIVTSLTVGMASNAKLLQLLALSRSQSALAATASTVTAATATAATSALEFTAPSLPALIMAVISIVSKEWLFRVTRKVGQQLQSTVVIANAWHHRSDAYSSVLAAASIGLAMYVPGFIFADASAGLFVAAMIGITGMEILGESVLQLTDTKVPSAGILATDDDDHDHDHNHHHDAVSTIDTMSETAPTNAGSSHAQTQRLVATSVSDGDRIASRQVALSAAQQVVEQAASQRHLLESRVRDEIVGEYDHLIAIQSLSLVPSQVLISTAPIDSATARRLDTWTVNVSIQVRPDLTTDEADIVNTAKTVAGLIRRKLEGNAALGIDKVHVSLDLSDG